MLWIDHGEAELALIHKEALTSLRSLDIELPSPDTLGGRRGVHAEHFIQQHTEMNEVRCADPGASW